MHTVFSTQGTKPAEAWQRWAAMSSREFYDGTLESASSEVPEFEFDKGLAFPISITRLTSSISMGYTRSWQHIRANRVGLRVFWFVQRGRLRFVRSDGAFEIKAGEAGIVDTNAPFNGRIVCDPCGVFESIQALVPANLYLAHLAHAETFTGRMGLDSPHGRVVTGLLDMLIQEGDQLGDKAARSLVGSFLDAVSPCVADGFSKSRPPQTLADKRLSDVKNFVLMNFTDPELSADRVAAGCGISPRYLSHILSENDTCFTELLWQQRLPMAREQLLSGARGRLISEVAFMSGFKSAAHFCRMFKDAYGCTPREFRAAHQGAVAGLNA
ncbi:MAG: AraC family transcriptional regulator [Gammaproteobacteria bacterium]